MIAVHSAAYLNQLFGVLQLTTRSHHRVHVLRALRQALHLAVERVHAVLVLLPLQLQSGQLIATLLEAQHLGGPSLIGVAVLRVDALAIGGVRLAEDRLGAFVERVELRSLGLRERKRWSGVTHSLN